MGKKADKSYEFALVNTYNFLSLVFMDYNKRASDIIFAINASVQG